MGKDPPVRRSERASIQDNTAPIPPFDEALDLASLPRVIKHIDQTEIEYL
jgi:hypothetical protein